MTITPTILFKKGAIELIDQTLLPAEYKILRIDSVDVLCEAIASLRIRGAPALGVAGAFGLLLAGPRPRFRPRWSRPSRRSHSA